MSVFRGCGVSIVTPFHKGAIDFTAFTRLIELQIAAGTDAIIVCDVAGEGETLSTDERLSVIQFVVERVNSRLPVIAAAGGANTQSVIEQAKAAEAIGVDALLAPAPYFTRSSQSGLIAHFNAIADSVGTPILLYNVPDRTGTDIAPETMARLSGHENIVGVKEESGDIRQIVSVAALCPGFDIYSGNDDSVIPVLSVGGQGVVSTIANILPDSMHAMCEAFFAGKVELARDFQFQMIPLWRAAFSEASPLPIKTMLGMMKLCDPDVRLPLTPLAEGASMQLIRETLRAYQLI